jgi:hypothetical protein
MLELVHRGRRTCTSCIVYRVFFARIFLNGWEGFWGSRSQVGEAKGDEAGGRRGRVSKARGWRGGAIAARMPGAGPRWRE